MRHFRIVSRTSVTGLVIYKVQERRWWRWREFFKPNPDTPIWHDNDDVPIWYDTVEGARKFIRDQGTYCDRVVENITIL
jgi:hypothetical protein